MSKRQAAMLEENVVTEAVLEVEDVQDPPPETRRTRSGRKVRTPAALLDSEAPARTPSRRTRRSVLQELPPVEEKNTENAGQKLESVPAEPELCNPSEPAKQHTEAAADPDRVDGNGIGPTPVETAPTSSEAVPKKKHRSGSSGKPLTPVLCNGER
ncbi:hypothetical protein FQN60_011884 [Etheostoma spectabile]|uniref:Uncharacterized protein n=1 Tax=Etheostoma spectabile TaxID=54343 RepID=A0A5J5DNF5_9PERO|nr:hypothetical protein FQN60_011884 [Etheostoma spectabile]